MCFCKNKKQEIFTKLGNVFILLPSVYWRILCSLRSQWNLRFSSPPESTETKISSQNDWSLPTKRGNFFYTYAGIWYSHVLFKQFKSKLFPRTNYRQNLGVHLLSPRTDVFTCASIYMCVCVPLNCSLNEWPILYVFFGDLHFHLIIDLRDSFC